MLFKKLNLDEKQEQQFEQMRKAHFKKRDSLRNEFFTSYSPEN